MRNAIQPNGIHFGIEIRTSATSVVYHRRVPVGPEFRTTESPLQRKLIILTYPIGLNRIGLNRIFCYEIDHFFVKGDKRSEVLDPLWNLAETRVLL